MPKRKLPTYRKHSSGQAMVEWNKQRHYLGKYGSPESRAAFARFLAAIAEGKPNPVAAIIECVDDPIGLLVVRFLDHAQSYYPGGHNSEYENLRRSASFLNARHERTSVRAFGPIALTAMRDEMIATGWSRGYINSEIKRIRRIFRWGVANEMVPPDVLSKLEAMQPLSVGRSEARETEPVLPVNDYWVAATLPFLPPPVSAMVQIQRVAGMRPGEVCKMQGATIDRSGSVWIYQPPRHKTSHRRKPRVIALPPSVQPVLEAFLTDDPTAYLFSPRAAMQWRSTKRRESRKTPLSPSHAKRVRRISRRIRNRYDTRSYSHAIRHAIRAARKAGVTIQHWSPNQLRHTAADEAARLLSPMAAQYLLGHSQLATTNIYLSQQVAELVRIATAIDATRSTGDGNGANIAATNQPIESSGLTNGSRPTEATINEDSGSIAANSDDGKEPSVRSRQRYGQLDTKDSLGHEIALSRDTPPANCHPFANAVPGKLRDTAKRDSTATRGRQQPSAEKDVES
jgi:integrase